jgi:hypothetical protein
MLRSARVLLAISVLVLASLACQALAGGGDVPVAEPQAPVQEAAPAESESVEPAQPPAQEQESAPAAGLGFETEFPIPDDASNGFDLGNGMVSFQTGLALEEALAFYRDSFSAAGYAEREITTVVSDTTFSIVFDGHESGKAIVVQAVDLGGGLVNITIRFEDI